jgi:cytochrome c biogenesis protein CcmG, thiol:disulfide interchange protein DsbE
MIDRRRFLHVAGSAMAVPLGVSALAPAPAPSSTPDPDPIAKDYRVARDHPLNFSIRVLDGPDFTLHDHHGSVVLVNFFATWCGPCREETPDLVDFATAHSDDTLVLGVNVAEADDTVRAFRKKYGVSYPIAMDAHGGYMKAMFRGDMLYPSTVVYGASGYVVAAWKGTRDRDGFERVRRLALGQT